MITLLSVVKSVIAIICVFVVSIVVHEFGHYIVAKKSGVAVPAFAIGFGPKLVRWTRRGTEFSVRLFPIGGMVQLAGELPQDALFRRGERLAVEFDQNDRIVALGDPTDLPNGTVVTLRDLDLMNRLQMTLETDAGTATYHVAPHARLMTSKRNFMPIVERHEQVLGKPLWQRAAMILAGPVMNFLLAGVLFSVLNLHLGVPLNTPTLGRVVPGSPAAAAGLRTGDQVLEVDGKSVHTWVQMVYAIWDDKSKPPKPIDLSIDRAGLHQSVVVQPRLVKEAGRQVPQLGVNVPLSFNPLVATGNGMASVWTQSANAVQLYGQVVAHHEYKDLSGPVGIADVISQGAQTGIWQVIWITALLSLNLGLFNLLPIPALDGGRLLFMVVELVRGKAVDPRKEGLVHFVGFALLMLFAVVITYRDVTRLF